MRGMILAAGRGSRMAHLTSNLPKPLLKVGEKTLIEYRIEAFALWGIRELVINLQYLGGQIQQYLGDGSHLGVSITYSQEDTLLEVGGGIYHALPLLGPNPFMTMNADIWTDFFPVRMTLPVGSLAHLLLVPNPSHHLAGDFFLENGVVSNVGGERLTFGGIALYHPDFFKDCQAGSFPLRDVLQHHIPSERVTGECYTGVWHDIGTPARLMALRQAESV